MEKPVPEDKTASGNRQSGAPRKFEYPEIPNARFSPCWEGWGERESGEAEPDYGAGEDTGDGGVDAGAGVEADVARRIEDEKRRSFEAGRASGFEEGRKVESERAAGARAAADEQRVRREAETIEKFAAERERYFASVEPEVVRLALAAASRILRRESSADPLLLLGAVRAALGQIAAAAEVRVVVPAAEQQLWKQAIALLPNLAVKPAVAAGEGMEVGDCRIECSLGAADLGLRAQLAEVERALLGDGGGAKIDVRGAGRDSLNKGTESAA